MEQWRDYYTYKISDKGRIVNRHGREVKGIVKVQQGYPYRTVELRIDKKSVYRNVGALVYRLFTGYEGDARVYHIDGNFENCSLDNLAISKAYTVAPTAEQVDVYEKNVVGCVKGYFKNRGWFELKRTGLDVDNALGNAYLLAYKYLPQFAVGTNFYAFTCQFAKWAFFTEYKQYKKQQEIIKNLKCEETFR